MARLGSIAKGVCILAALSLLLVAGLWRSLVQTQRDRGRRVVEHLQDLGVRSDLAAAVAEMVDSKEGNRNAYTSDGIRLRTSSENYCSLLEPWFPNQTYSKTQLVFFAKPMMNAVRSISIERRWKMKLILNDSGSGISELEQLLSPEVFTILFTSSRALRHPIVQQLANSTNALVSGVRYAFKTTGAKKGQLQSFRSYLNSFGCSLEDLKIMPPSFLLDEPSDCVQFFRYASTRPSSYWVLKTSQGYGGDGITILPNLTRLHRDFGTCQGNEEFVVQEYLPNLLLVEGRKFDVRALVLIAGTNPYFLFHHEGYLRVSVKQFDLHGDRAVHLTNSHVQVFSAGFKPDKHFWSFQRFQEFLDTYHPDNNDFVHNRLVPFIKKIGLFILQTGLKTFARLPSTFQLLGLDFMVTHDYNVWLIEANNYPLWPKGEPYIDELISGMGRDMFDLLFDLRRSPERFTDMKPGDRYKSWELVWSEFDTVCHSELGPYNPCHELKS